MGNDVRDTVRRALLSSSLNHRLGGFWEIMSPACPVQNSDNQVTWRRDELVEYTAKQSGQDAMSHKTHKIILVKNDNQEEPYTLVHQTRCPADLTTTL